MNTTTGSRPRAVAGRVVIAHVVGFLRDRLNAAFPRDASGSAEDMFVYVGGNKDDAVVFASNAVSVLLVRIEEETTLRPPDRNVRVAADGVRKRVEPEIRMNLFVLFVARFPDDYSLSLQQLSRVVRYFQNHRVFTHANAPELDAQIPQLILNCDAVLCRRTKSGDHCGSRINRAPCKVRMVLFRRRRSLSHRP
jgi:hypothetical protein